MNKVPRKIPRTIRSMSGPQRTAVIAFFYGQSWGFSDAREAELYLQEWLGKFFKNEPIAEHVRGHLEIIKDLADISYSGRMPQIKFRKEISHE